MRRALPVLCLAVLLGAQTAKDWQSVFPVNKKSLGVQGANPYFPLTPGYQLSYRDGKDTDTLTVLAATRVIDGVECRIVEDREMKNGLLVELTRDYYAIDSATNDVYYMGEDVDVYKNGTVAGHEGAWLSGVKGASFGLMMPGKPREGQRFYQEQAPGVGMDRVEIVSETETVVTPAGTFRNCIHAAETTPLEKGVTGHKWYAAGIGPVKDAGFVLAKYGSISQPK
ncbi:conserved exported hypothetical protein [Candidatus Sulfopaludibacter sp. SbA3]|nr:conserved exported hypothetical protein [Candidatus Sulfopaludibacter sp. SbA3]